MSAQQILEHYRSGERKPVLGPLTYVEALGLLVVNEKLLDALKGLVAVPFGSGAALLQAKIKAHHAAHVALKIAGGVNPVTGAPHCTGFQNATPICGNCQHETRMRDETKNRTDRSCTKHGWTVLMSATCDGHAYRPT
ncbi:hypothetical protein BA896_021910 [Janthinobacterium lividum]|uniref:Uncharacterized protein n=1 Tax=Janthinobacterium lividum TaxID=29581 RepID=A0A1E8PJB7_9BURK|nr:hypothetical protein BA896_021910 [Janthinobacterium lividum]